jgi:hypothetical protein
MDAGLPVQTTFTDEVTMNRFEGAALAAALTISLVAGCGKLDNVPVVGTSSLTCAHNPCEVSVSVTGSGADCVPTVPDPVIVDKAGGAIVIRWLAPSGYTFSDKAAPTEGIHFKDGPGPINPNPGSMQGGKAWQVEDRPDPHASAAVSIRYQINLVANDGSSCNGKDPLISNR